MGSVVSQYLGLPDSQRESVIVALEGLTDSQLWRRPTPKEWSIGELLDLHRSPEFPHGVGFLWTPRYNTRKPVPLATLQVKMRALHAENRRFYQEKPQDVLGNLYLSDPFFGWCNLIVTLRISIYHDQRQYDDAMIQALEVRK